MANSSGSAYLDPCLDLPKENTIYDNLIILFFWRLVRYRVYYVQWNVGLEG